MLAYAKAKGRLKHFRGRHQGAVDRTLEVWSGYLLGTTHEIGNHEIHLLPFCGVIDCNRSDTPQNLNRYLRRVIEIDTVVSDREAITYCKLGPVILIGLIEYADCGHWQNTRINKIGRFGPRDSSCPIQYQDYIFKRSRRLQELEAGLSDRQLQKIEASYIAHAAKLETSDTYRTRAMDHELQLRREAAARPAHDPEG